MTNPDPLVDASIYRLLIEQVKDYALIVLDPSGRIMTWNLGAQRIKGYAAEEIIGRHFSAFYTADAVNRGWPAEELRLATGWGQEDDRARSREAGFELHLVKPVDPSTLTSVLGNNGATLH